MPTTLGIDIGGTATKLALIQDDQPPATARTDTYREPSAENLANAIQQTAATLTDPTQIQRVGLCVPGPVNAQGVLEAAANMPALIGRNLNDWTQTLFPEAQTIALCTDAVAAAIADHHNNPTTKRSLYLSIGTGLGGAVLDAGIPLIVTRGTPGHLGHIDVSGTDPNPPQTPGAGRGALEAYIGARGLNDDGVPLETPEELQAALTHPRVHRGLDALARGIRTFLVIYRPDEIVFMGGVAPLIEHHLDHIKTAVHNDISPAAPGQVNYRFTKVGRFAAAIGAAHHASQTSHRPA
ncbi:ROK family protein [Mucisphaera sp.]|uniref:ROK family protein n=1 Tax=Mucisphaera sp. TaxID=2913024 RepID=UPI003D139CA5